MLAALPPDILQNANNPSDTNSCDSIDAGNSEDGDHHSSVTPCSLRVRKGIGFDRIICSPDESMKGSDLNQSRSGKSSPLPHLFAGLRSHAARRSTLRNISVGVGNGAA